MAVAGADFCPEAEMMRGLWQRGSSDALVVVGDPFSACSRQVLACDAEHRSVSIKDGSTVLTGEYAEDYSAIRWDDGSAWVRVALDQVTIANPRSNARL
mmetsp:Transcript_28672/g.74042  ORF Transcript_28672/g.74042 Transcript_28672/m.74042 type:complete len:99 (-) Transcript_28672:23-319(-)